MQALVTASLGSCFPLQPSAEASPPADAKAPAASLWCVSNAAATFTVVDAGADKPTGVLVKFDVCYCECAVLATCDAMLPILLCSQPPCCFHSCRCHAGLALPTGRGASSTAGRSRACWRSAADYSRARGNARAAAAWRSTRVGGFCRQPVEACHQQAIAAVPVLQTLLPGPQPWPAFRVLFAPQGAHRKA
jgi:hypothetical protein